MKTRQEQIADAAKEKYGNNIQSHEQFEQGEFNGFIEGAEWADKNPVTSLGQICDKNSSNLSLNNNLELCFEEKSKLQECLAVAREALGKISIYGIKLGGKMNYSDEALIAQKALAKINEVLK